MRYDGGIRVAQWEHGAKWAIGYGEEDTFPDVGIPEGHEEKLLELFYFLALGCTGELSIEAMAHKVRSHLGKPR